MSPSDDNWRRDLSTDVNYLLEVAHIKPGCIGHSRWLTKTSRILRLYVATKDPSTVLKTLTQFVIIYGSPLLAKFIRFTQNLTPEVRKIINPEIQNNSYFAHPENVLLSMLYDERKSVRDQAIQTILYYRDNLHDETRLRPYKKIEINFYCFDYVNID